MNTAEKVKMYRLRNAWSQEQLADLTSLSARTVQRIESGQKPGLETLAALASAFELHAADLQDDPDEQPDSPPPSPPAAASASQARFFRKLASFIIVCAALLMINYLFSPHSRWALIVTLVWGLLLAVRAFNLFVLAKIFPEARVLPEIRR